MSGNPLFNGWYADPELHYFAGRYYIYPTTSRAPHEQASFECWSSADLTNWRNEGVILDFKDVPWSTNYAAWAPSCAEKNGRYYLYFSAGDGAGLGVAVSDSPAGPFRDAIGRPLVSYYPHGAQPIDAHCFVDEDGRAYLYFGGHGHCVVAPLTPTMCAINRNFREITPSPQYVEGPFMVKRRGVTIPISRRTAWRTIRTVRSSIPEGFLKTTRRLQTARGITRSCTCPTRMTSGSSAIIVAHWAKLTRIIASSASIDCSSGMTARSRRSR
jgi:hypothetical protein